MSRMEVIFLQAGFGRDSIAQKVSHYSGGFEHPGVSRMLALGELSPQREYRCPACGKSCELCYVQWGTILGCDRCVREREPWEIMEEMDDDGL